MAKNQTATKETATATADKEANRAATTTALSTAAAGGAVQVHAQQPNFEEDTGMGTEGVDKDSQAIPFLAILQSNSPAVAESLVEGAKPGMFMNTVTNELFESVLVVPCAFERRYVEWAPRKLGGGFKGQHMPLDVESGKVGYAAEGGGYYVVSETVPTPLPREKAKDAHNMLKDTRSHYVLVVRPDGTFFPALFPLASTQIKKSKKLVSMILGVQLRKSDGTMYNPASFSHCYRLTTTTESNDQGSWKGVLVEAAGPVKDSTVYAAAKEFNKLVLSGQVKVAQPDEYVDAGDGGEEERAF